jgi:amino acid adenylation domain-containing protein
MDKQDILAIYPLTATQQGMLFHALSEPSTTAYVEQVSRRLPRSAPALFAQAWARVAEHYDALRTGFRWEAIDRPAQLVFAAATPVPTVLDWRALAEPEREARLEAHLREDRARGFDLTRPPLMRLTQIAWSDDEDVFVWTYHHMVLDGWSAFRVIDEVLAAYDALERGQSFVASGPRAFKPYVTWLRQRDAAADETWWRAYLRDFRVATPLNLGLDAPWRDDGASGPTTVVHDVRAGTMDALRAVARRNRVTLNTCIQAVWAFLLSRCSGENDVVFGTTVSGRPPELPDCERMVGLFINTLPARVRLSAGMTVAELLQAIQAGDRGRLEHAYSPLVEIQGWSALPQGARMFDSLLAVESFPGSEHFTLDQIRVVQETNYTLALVVEPNRELRLRALFDAAQTSPETVRNLLRRFEAVLIAMIADVDARLAQLPFALPEEIERQARWNRTAAPYEATGSIADRFVACALRTPEATAVDDGVLRLSYAELLDRADRLAGALQARGARRGDVVAMLFAPSTDMIVAAVGIVRAGCAYAPLDPTHPRERQAGILADLRAPLFVTHRDAADGLDVPADCALLRLEDTLAAAPAPRLDHGPFEPTDPVYVMHTSGSTGKPKAAGVYHHSFVNLMSWWNAEFGFGADDRVLLVNKISFDLLQKNVWGALCSGGEVHVVPDLRYDPVRVRAWIRERGISWMNCTPSMAYALLDCVEDDDYADFASLRLLMLGGEAVQKSRFARWQASPARRTEIVNTYGPTECADLCGVHRFAPEEFARPELPVTVGAALPNIRLYVLDDQWRPLPPFTLGEVVIGGVSVGTGYLNNAAMSAEKFFPDFIDGAPGARLYRTGDTGYMGPDGRIYVRGRVDFQVKLRGQRIELEEIDAIARRCAWVEDAVTVLAEGERLVSYLSLRAEAPEDWRDALHATLSRNLAAGLVPSAFVRMDALPLNDNGKVNRAALPPFSPADLIGGDARVAPRDDTERGLAAIWAAVLGHDGFGVTDDFFELGGHSLSITQIYSRIPKAFGVSVALSELFSEPTIAGQAELIAAARAQPASEGDAGADAAPTLAPRERPPSLPLSSSQARFWFLQQYEPENPACNVPSVLRFSGFDGDTVRRALVALCQRHEPLRTRFALDDEGRPCQRIEPEARPEWRSVDLSAVAAEVADAEIAALAADQVSRSFDLAAAPPARYLWVRLADDRALLLVTLHHIIIDGWSMEVFERELRALCAQLARGETPALPPLPLQYADHALWQREWLASEDAARQLEAWRAALADGSNLIALPFDRQRAERRDYRGGVVRRLLPPALSARIKAAAERAKVTPYMLLLAAFQAFVHRISDQDDFNIGSPVANRHRRETEGLIGLFVNTIVLRARIGAGDDFSALLQRTRGEVLAAQSRQDLPFETLVEHLGGERHPALNPLFQVLFSVQAAYEDTSLIPEGAWVSRFDLQVIFSETADGWRGAWEYSADLFDRATVERFAAQFAALLDDALSEPARPLAQLRLGEPHAPAAQLRPYPRDAAIDALFADVARAAPERVALRCGDAVCRYGELADMARRIAGGLAARGVAPGARVGIGLSRGVPLIAGLLGILAAGAAYVPLDPAYPAERLALMAGDAEVALVIAPADGLAAWQAMGIEAIDIDTLLAHAPAAEAPRSGGDAPAYIVYTSGSTGRPKGVEVPHRAVVRLVRETDYCPLDAETVMLQAAPVAFDASTFEIWGALLNGGELAISPGDSVDIADLAALIAQHRVNTAWLTSGLFDAWSTQLRGPSGLRWLLTGGEAMNPEALRRVLAADPHVTVVNGYGPTENTTFSTWYPVPRDRDPRRPVPIGRAIANSTVAVMDAAGRRLPVGVPGELWVGGEGLALGYRGQPALTAERFVADPEAPQTRMYRTGDIVRYDADGELIFLGRRDGQVKLRGFRIELDEVRAALAAQPGVAAAVAAIRDLGPTGRQLLAWVVPADSATLAEDALRAQLRQRLPGFMVPARIVPVASIPLNANGKVDVAALPAPAAATGAAARVEPAGETEQAIWEIWAQMLGTREFGATDGFFELGGHSLVAARTIAAIEQVFGVRLPLRDLFAGPTVREVALAVDLLRWRDAAVEDAAEDAEREVGVL